MDTRSARTARATPARAPRAARQALLAGSALLVCAAGLAACTEKLRPDEELETRQDVACTPCGGGRWSVKTASDTDIGTVRATPVDALIGDLADKNKYPVPGSLYASTPRTGYLFLSARSPISASTGVA